MGKSNKSSDALKSAAPVSVKLSGSSLSDTLVGGVGNDKIYGNRGNDSLDGGIGNDQMAGGTGSDTLLGGAGNDTMDGDGKGGSGWGASDGFADYLDGGTGDDLMIGGAGNDTVLGGAGNDRLYGDRAHGSGGGSGGSGYGSGASVGFDDYLDGGTGNDLVVGGRGADTVLGGSGDDIVFGDAAGSGRNFGPSGGGSGSGHGSGSGSGHGSGGFNDYLDGGAGNDFVLGGGGDDEANYVAAENLGARDDYRGGDGIDTLTLQLTQAEWFRPEVQADIANYLAFIAAHTDPTTGEADNAVFQFTAFNLSAREFESLRVFVDGVELDPRDAAVTPVADAATVNEDDAAVAITGSVLDNDAVPDLAYAVALVSGPAAGVLTFNAGTPGAPDGSYSFDPNGEFEWLAAGESTQVSFVYEVTDANGDTGQGTVTIAVTGSNDAPLIQVIDVFGNITEGGVLADTGTLGFTDVDLSNRPTASFAAASVTAVAQNGVDALALSPAQVAAINASFSLTNAPANTNNGTVAWDYAIAESSLNFLGAGETVTATFSVTVTDDSLAAATQDVTITLHGTNDSPLIQVVDVQGAVVEGAVLTDAGSLTFTDVDLTDAPTAAVAASSVSAVLANGIDALALDAGQTAALQSAFSISADAGNGNDGTVNWAYAIAETAVDFLAAGEVATATFTVTVSDDQGPTAAQDVTVTITGTNDAPVILSADAVGAVTDAVSGGVGGVAALAGLTLLDQTNITLAAVQIEAGGDGTTNPDLITGPVGAQISYTATGAFLNGTYGVTNLNDGDVGAGVASDGLYAIPYQGNPSVVLNLDGTQTLGSIALHNGYGNRDDGIYTLRDGAGNLLGQWSVSGTPGATNDGVHSIWLTFDAPVTTNSLRLDVVSFDAQSTVSFREIQLFGVVAPVLTDIGAIQFDDIDLTDSHSVSALAAAGGYLGSFAVAVNDPATGLGDGSVGWSFSVDNAAVDFLVAGQQLVQTYSVTIDDGQGGTVSQDVTITITGTNDAPVVGAALTSTAAEDAAGYSLDLLAGASDIDTGETATLNVQNVVGLVAGITLSGNALLVDPANAAFQSLAVGESAVITVGYDVVDAQGAVVAQTATITITGTNDAPVVSGALFNSASEDDAGFSVDLLAGASDVDVDETANIAVQNVTGLLAGVTLSGNSLLVDPGHAAFQSLAVGESAVITVGYDVADVHGAVVAQTATVTIIGTNDAPVAMAQVAATVLVEQGYLVAGTALVSGALSLTGIDVDATDIVRVAAADADTGEVGAAVTFTPDTVPVVQGRYGALTIDADGGWSYALNNADADTEALASGQTVFETFSYTVSDGNGGQDSATLTLEIAGSDDNAPPVANDDQFTLTEDTPTTLALLANDADANVGQAISIVSINGVAATVGATIATQHGSITIGAGGSVNYTAAANYNGADSFTYIATDGLETSASATVDLTITAVNDAPTLEAPAAGNKVAVVGFRNGSAVQATAQLNDDTYFDFEADAYLTTDLTSFAAWQATLSLYDVVVFGGSGYSGDSGSDISPFFNALVDYANNGGGIVATTWLAYELNRYSLNAQNAIIAVTPISGISQSYDAQPFDFVATDPGHPILDGLNLATVTGGIYWNTLNNSDASSTSVATIGGAGAIVVQQLASGANSVWLGGTYLGAANIYANAPLRSGGGDRLFEQAVNWAAGGGSALVTDEDTALSVVGLAVADIDAAEGTGEVQVTLAVTHGSVALADVVGLTSVSNDGSANVVLTGSVAEVNEAIANLTFTPDANFNGAAAVTVTVDDLGNSGAGGPLSASHTLEITVDAVNDAPVVAAPVVSTAAEDSAGYSLSLLAGASDVDSGHTASLSVQNVVGLTAGVTLAGNSLIINPAATAFRALAVGQSAEITVNYNVDDAKGAAVAQTATITITGTNDAPTVGTALTTTVAEDAAGYSLNLLTGASDADSGETATLAVQNVAGLAAGVSLSGNSLLIDPSDAVLQSLAVGQSLSVNVTYDVVDAQGAAVAQSARVTFTGTNDLPVFSASNVAAGSATSGVFLPGTLVANGDFEAVNIADGGFVGGSFAGWTATGAGPWYASGFTDLPNGLINQPVGTPADNQVGFTNLGGTSQSDIGTLSADPAFVVGFDVFTRLDSNGGASFAVDVLIDGVDVGLRQTGVGPANGGHAHFNLSFDLNALDLTAYTPGVSVVSIAISNIASNSQFVFDNVTVGAPLVGTNGALQFTDVDSTDSHNISVADFAPGYLGQFTATLAADATGGNTGQVNWNFAVDNRSTAFLAAGEQRVQTYVVTLGDGNGGTAEQMVTVTLVGTNDGPVVSGQVALAAIAEDSGARLISQAELLANATDADSPTLTAINLSVSAGNGVLVNNNDGTWSYTPAPNDDTSVTFAYQVTDGVAAPVAASATLDITPVNDAPQIPSALLAIAYTDTVNNGGNYDSNADRLIAAIRDTDGSGTVTIGDKIELGSFPTNRNATAFVEFQTTSYSVSSVSQASINPSNPDSFIFVVGIDDGANPDGSLSLNFSPGNFEELSISGGTALLGYLGIQDALGGALHQDIFAWDLSSDSIGNPSPVPSDTAQFLGRTGDHAFMDFDAYRTPSVLVVDEDSSGLISGVVISDIDAGSGAFALSLGVNHGGLSLTSTAGLTFIDADGSDGTLSFFGTLADVNTAMSSSVLYAPDLDFFGNDQLTVFADDLGSIGTGGPLTDTAMFNIIVNDLFG